MSLKYKWLLIFSLAILSCLWVERGSCCQEVGDEAHPTIIGVDYPANDVELPSEIWVKILSFLPTQDYMSVASVSKVFYVISHQKTSLLEHFAQIANNRHLLGVRYMEIQDRFRMMWHGHAYQHKKKQQTLLFCEQYEADLKLLWKEVIFHMLGFISTPIDFLNEVGVKSRVFHDGLPTELLYLVRGCGLPVMGHNNQMITNQFKLPVNPSRYLGLNLIMILDQVLLGIDAALGPDNIDREYLSQEFCNSAKLVMPYLMRLLPEFDDLNLELCPKDKWARKHWIYFDGVGLIRVIPNPVYEPRWEDVFDELHEM